MAYNTKDINQLIKEKNQKYTTAIYEASATVTYVCHAVITGTPVALSDAVWRITKIDNSSTPKKISFADFSDTFDKVASSYASYTYL